MKRSELIKEVSYRTGYTQMVCSEIIKEAINVICLELEGHGDVQLPNLGVFDVYSKKATKVRMPNTGDLITVEGRSYPRFIPADKLKARVQK